MNFLTDLHRYRSDEEDEEDEEEDEEEGSSIEEADHDRVELHDEEGGADTEEAPAYSGSAPIEVGPNGYAVSHSSSVAIAALILHRSRRRTSTWTTRSQRPMLPLTMPLPSEICLDENKRHPLVTESSPLLVRTFHPLLVQVKVPTPSLNSVKSHTPLPQSPEPIRPSKAQVPNSRYP